MKLCVDLGATNIKSAIIDDYKIIKNAVNPTNTSNGLDGIVCSLKKSIDCLIEKSVTEICVSSAGTIDSDKGVVIYATPNLPNYTGFNIVDWIEKEYGIKGVAINDGLSALLGEIAINKEYINKKIVMLTLGSGVGGAYAINGKIKADESNNFALFGHICIYKNGKKCNCGKVGCIEQYLSGRALNRQAENVGIVKDTLFDEYKKGNIKAVEIINDFKKNLMLSLKEIYKINTFDFCILGGGVVDGMKDCFNGITSNLGFIIKRATAGNSAGMLGAYYFAENK